MNNINLNHILLDTFDLFLLLRMIRLKKKGFINQITKTLKLRKTKWSKKVIPYYPTQESYLNGTIVVGFGTKHNWSFYADTKMQTATHINYSSK